MLALTEVRVRVSSQGLRGFGAQVFPCDEFQALWGAHEQLLQAVEEELAAHQGVAAYAGPHGAGL